MPQYAFTRESWAADEPDADEVADAEALAELDDAAVLDDPDDPPHATSPRQHAHSIAAANRDSQNCSVGLIPEF